MDKIYTLKTIKHCWEKLNKTYTNGMTSHVHGLKQSILLRCQFSPILSIDSM